MMEAALMAATRLSPFTTAWAGQAQRRAAVAIDERQLGLGVQGLHGTLHGQHKNRGQRPIFSNIRENWSLTPVFLVARAG
jgi:hypothetical protein